MVEDELFSLDQLSVKAVDDTIAKAIWDDYQHYLCDQGER